MRAIISPSGSFMAIAPPSLPARLDQARDQPLGAEIPKRDARQVRELERCRESLLHRIGLVAGNGLEPSASAGILLAQLAPPAVLLDRTFLRHQCLLAFRSCG